MVMKWKGMLKSAKVCKRVLMHIEECQGVLGQNIKGALGQNSWKLMNMRNVCHGLVLMRAICHAKEGVTRYAKHW